MLTEHATGSDDTGSVRLVLHTTKVLTKIKNAATIEYSSNIK
jgi:hypothetical protein